uniref:Amino acid transporter n=1 Tax=Cupiennius salei TaxID=6928 RepID=A0A061QLJ1_CUPSA
MAAKEDGGDKRKKRGSGDEGCTVSPWCRRNGFLLLLLLATVVGYILGVVLKPLDLSNHTLHLIGYPGQLVIRSFLMIIVPLLFCSLVLGVSSLRKGGDARMVALTICFFLALSTLSAIMGAAAGHLVHPGQKISSAAAPSEGKMSGRKGLILDSMLDLLWNAVPDNIVEATFVKEYTHVEVLNTTLSSDDSLNSTVIYKKTLQQKRGVNFMGLLTFSILFGCALAVLGEKGEQLHQVIEQLNAVVMSIMGYCLSLLPLGMFFWMLREGLESGAPAQLLGHLGLFLATAFGCIAFHQIVLLPLLYLVFIRKNPVRYHLNLLPAILTAFGTSSSAATLPMTVRCAEETNRLNRCVTRFVLPLGMVIHMNGGTFYMVLSSLFLAQLEGIQIGMPETVVMCVTSILLFISAPATAGGGNPVYLLTVLAAGGVSRPQFISIVLSMEWLMERFRTVMNVVADSYVAAIVERLCSNRLPPEDGPEVCDPYPSPVLHGYDHETVLRHGEVCRSCGSTIEMTHRET